MKPHEENYNGSVSTMSTDRSLADYKQGHGNSINTTSGDFSLKDTKENNESKEHRWKTRYYIVVVSFLLYLYNLYIRLNMSVTVVAMVNNSAMIHQDSHKSESCLNLIQNITEVGKIKKKEGEFDWSPKIQGYVLATYSLGQFSSQMPAGLLAERYGAKWFIFVATLVSAVITLLIPLLSYLSLSLLMVSLVLRGFLQGMIAPALTTISANWFPKAERGFLIAFTITGCCLGSCSGSILSGLICDSEGGWTASFYATGAWGLFLSLLILLFLFENPKAHPRISQCELNFILSNQENVLLRKRPKLPWRKILTSVPVYALAYAFFASAWAVGLFWTVHSTFLATILHYPIRENGLLTALPFGLQFLVSQIASWTTLYVHKKNICRAGFLRKFWTFLSYIGISFCLLGMYLSGCNRLWSVVFSVLCTGFTGFAFSGCWIVPADMTPTFAGTLNAICLTLALPSTFLVPVAVGYLTNGMQTIEQWNKVFFLTIGIVMSSGIIFSVFGSAEVQSWNFVEEKTTDKDKTKTDVIKKETNE